MPSIHQEDKKIDATVGKTWIRNTFTNPVTMSDVVLSIKDIPYPLLPNTAFHPVNTDAALNRIRYDFEEKVRNKTPLCPSTIDMIITTMLGSKQAQAVWAIAFEYRNQPLYVVRNLAHTNTTLPYRRVLVVKLDSLTFNYPMRTWDQVRSNLTHEEFYPLTSMTTWQ